MGMIRPQGVILFLPRVCGDGPLAKSRLMVPKRSLGIVFPVYPGINRWHDTDVRLFGGDASMAGPFKKDLPSPGMAAKVCYQGLFPLLWR